MPVASNTSPLYYLAVADRLDLLPTLVGDVLVPPVVSAELAAEGARLGATALRSAAARGWWRVVGLAGPVPARLVAAWLDPGEVAAIALALELGLRHVLMDDRQGRVAAVGAGLEPIGVLRVLLQAKADGLLPLVGPMVAVLRDEAGFYMSDSLHDAVLREAGEL